MTLVFGIYGLTLFGHDLSLPVGGWNGGAWRNMILPVIVLALPQTAIVARMRDRSKLSLTRTTLLRAEKVNLLVWTPQQPVA